MFHGVPNIGEGIVELSHCQPVTIFWWTNLDQKYINLREDINEKKRFLSGIARMRGGDYPCPNFLALFQEVHFWSIKRVYFIKNANVLNF